MKLCIGPLTLACVALAFVGRGSIAAAPVITFNPNTGFTTHSNVSQTVGWSFDLSTNFTVNQLGWYDQGADGLGESHPVGMWDSSQNLLVTATVPSGTAAALDGGYRMVSVSGILLGPGHYVIGGLNDPSAGDFLYYSVTQTVNPALTWFADQFSNTSSTLIFPGTQGQGVTAGFYGPMFGFVASASVPEPATYGLVGAALLAALLLRRGMKW